MNSFDEIVQQIVSIEWDMFQAVNDGGPRAACQDDRPGFEAMRGAQFAAWSEEARESYLNDLRQAAAAGRNLVMEKYVHMMRYSAPAQYERLRSRIAAPEDKARATAREICDKLLDETVALHEKYPYVSGSGRPLRSVSDLSGVTSVETYQLGELLTYSAATLEALKRHLLSLEGAGRSLARDILENTVATYGYRSLEDAEAATRARIEGEGIQISFGCDDGC